MTPTATAAAPPVAPSPVLPVPANQAPANPGAAAPMRAVDSWHSEPTATGFAVTARLRVDGDDPNLRGHFPGFPVLPGVFLVEALCQTMALATGGPGTGPAPRLRALHSVRFLAPLLGGDELTLRVEATAADGGWKVTAEGHRADGTRVTRVRAEFGGGSEREERAQRAPQSRTEGGSVTAVHEHVVVRRILPQRHPLLLVDRVEAVDPGVSIRTLKTVTATEPCYAHLPDDAPPDRYAYPVSLLIESLGQSAALLWMYGGPPVGDDEVLLFTGARGYRFERCAYPGDVLRHEVRLESVVADTAFARGETWVGDRRIASVDTLIAARRTRGALTPAEAGRQPLTTGSDTKGHR